MSPHGMRRGDNKAESYFYTANPKRHLRISDLNQQITRRARIQSNLNKKVHNHNWSARKAERRTNFDYAAICAVLRTIAVRIDPRPSGSEKASRRQNELSVSLPLINKINKPFAGQCVAIACTIIACVAIQMVYKYTMATRRTD